MLRAALGFRMHSGWGVVVAMDAHHSVLERQRIQLADDGIPGGRQPYHHARDLGIGKAERFLSEYAARCESSAKAELDRIISSLKSRRFQLAGAGLVLASARALPSLRQILSAHPLIHTAEGQLFREVVRRACEAAGLPVIGIAEKQLAANFEECFGNDAGKIKQAMDESGKSLGAPWNSDHKQAAMAGCLALHHFAKDAQAKRSGAYC
jgi:hypothetical protein